MKYLPFYLLHLFTSHTFPIMHSCFRYGCF